MSNRLLVLCWHNIDPTPAFPAPAGHGRQGFERQLQLLARFTTVIRLSTALDLIGREEPLPPRAVVLTFDDGYRDMLDLAVPALAGAGLPATFFLVPGFLSGRIRAWWEDLAAAFDRTEAEELTWDGVRHDLGTPAARRQVHDRLLGPLKRLDHAARENAVHQLTELLTPGDPDPDGEYFLDWNGARALVSAGHEVGSHSASHVILSRETATVQTAELADSRAQLQSALGVRVDTVAYPNGTDKDYDDTTIHIARETGYRCALTTRSGLAERDHSPYEMRRMVIGPTTNASSVARYGWQTARTRLWARTPRASSSC